jgi:acetoacetyl-CoA reductase
VAQRIAFVTGGTGGIGTAICRRLADDGVKVVAAYNNPEKAQKWQEAQKSDGYDFVIVQCNVTDFEACAAAVAEAESAVGPIDILVNNAGITKDGMFKKMDQAKWSSVIATNLDSLFNVTKQVTAGMSERGFGRIINISSVNGRRGQMGQVNYCTAKAGMYGFTMALARELATKGVTVNTLSPGYIATEMVMAIPEKVMDSILATIPMGRLGTPEEMAGYVSFMASDGAAYLTGCDISPNGGQHITI